MTQTEPPPSPSTDPLDTIQETVANTSSPPKTVLLFRDQISSVQWDGGRPVTSRRRESVVRRRGCTVMGRGTEDAAGDERAEQHRPAAMRDDSATTAATKIQAGFRGYKVRKQLKQTGGGSVKKGGARRRSSHGEAVSAANTSLKQQRSASLEERSATTIQAGIRGFLVRKKRQEETQAATKIQAGFRGFKARRAAKTRAQVHKRD